MKFICSSQILSEACMNVQRATSTKSTNLPTIEGIMIKAENDRIMLTGYDLEMGIITSVEGRVEQTGSVILNAKILCDILRRLPSAAVTINVDSHNLCKITSGESEFSLVGIPANDYPELPTVSGGIPFSIKQGILRDMVKQTIFAVAVQDIKPVHKGIKFEVENNNLRLISCDGFRLAIRNEAIEYAGEDMTFVVPAKTLSEVCKLADDDESNVSLSIGKKFILFEIGSFRIISRLLEGEFFNYKNAIPAESSTKARVNLKLILDSVERTSLLITSKIKSPVRCVYDENSIKISSATALGAANDKIPASIEGKRVEIGFNNTYLTDCLKTVDVDEVLIELSSPVSPIIVKPVEGDNFIFLIIPMRLKNENIV
mgnify:CR=1 FL=1